MDTQAKQELLAEWADAAFNAQENWTVSPHEHIERLTRAGDALVAALSRNEAPASLVALRHALWNLAGTIVACADDPVEARGRHARSVALSETSPLVDAARDAIASFGLSNETAPAAPSAPPEVETLRAELAAARAALEEAARLKWDAPKGKIHTCAICGPECAC